MVCVFVVFTAPEFTLRESESDCRICVKLEP